MSAMTATTMERVPMGASDLKAHGQKIFRRALILSCAVHLALIGGYLASKLYHPPDEVAYTGRVIRMETLPPPPPLSSAPPPPVITAPNIAKPTIGTPVPVPDAQAPEQTIMTQQELSQSIAPISGYGQSGKDSLVIKADDTPSEGEFVYYEDPPTPVNKVEPVYPEMAREAQIQGTVILHVLVGKDGRVKDIKVKRSVNYLDGPAQEAVRKWVFKPALSQNKPVAVWVEIPINFHF